ncbi:putative defensin-like protein [Cardamine amara subsp. amara]|uniref:Defensin-like protein n=1 Tax=Cardamine amara subsp. amara TaxID=228776 RepID=A0ABD1B2N0_CARAN
MISSSKCIFFVFLCLTALFTPNLVEAEDRRSKLIPIGPCSEIRDCNQTCIESQFLGGKCILWYSYSTEKSCACYVKPSISPV